MLYILVVLLCGCAIATGDRSIASVNTKTDTKREVSSDAPVIEELLIEKKGQPK